MVDKAEPDRSKIGKSNVRKGKTYERRVASLLGDFTGVQFRRRRVEGRDLSVVERESTADVIPVTGDIKFSIEAKSGKGFSFDAMLGNPSKNLFSTWWHQATYDAEILTKVLNRKIHPMLFFKYSTTQDWIVIPSDSIDGELSIRLKGILPQLRYKYTVNPVRMNISHTSKKKNYIEVDLELPDVSFIRWKDFAEFVEPASLFLEV